MRILLSVILFSLIGFISAQSKSEVFVSNNFEGSEGIQIKWIYEFVYHPDGFNVFRKENGGNWEKLNGTALSVKASLPSGNKLTKDQADLFTAVAKTPYEDFKQNIVRAFVLIESIYCNELAEYLGISFLDRTAQKGKTYTYKISTGSGTDLAESKPITCQDFKKTEAPENIKFFRKKSYITCNWKPDIYRYYAVDIYRKNADETEFKKMTEQGPIAIQPRDVKQYSENSVFYVDTAIDENTSYVYQFVAIDYFGQESVKSEEIKVPMQDFTPPVAPYGFKLTPSSTRSSVLVNWSSIEEADLAGFNIYYSTDPEKEFKKANKELLDRSINSYVHEGVAVGGYYYVVSSIDYAGNETPSGMMFTELIDRTPPEAPKNFKATSASGEITMTWDANSEGDLKGYYIQKSLSDGDNSDNGYINVNAEPLTSTTYTEKLPINVKNEFVYRVIAVDTLFNRSKPSVNSLAQMPDVIAPKSPVISNVVMSNGEVVVSWIPNVEKDLKGYELYRSVAGDTNTTTKININLIPGSVYSYNDRTYSEGVKYDYQVLAIDNSQNSSDLSPSFRINIPKEKLELTIEVEKATYNDKKQQIILQWIGPKEAEMRGYVVYMMDPSGTMKPVSGLSEFTEYKTKTETVAESYEFEIRGYTQTGEVIKTQRIAVSRN